MVNFTSLFCNKRIHLQHVLRLIYVSQGISNKTCQRVLNNLKHLKESYILVLEARPFLSGENKFHLQYH